MPNCHQVADGEEASKRRRSSPCSSLKRSCRNHSPLEQDVPIRSLVVLRVIGQYHLRLPQIPQADACRPAAKWRSPAPLQAAARGSAEITKAPRNLHRPPSSQPQELCRKEVHRRGALDVGLCLRSLRVRIKELWKRSHCELRLREAQRSEPVPHLRESALGVLGVAARWGCLSPEPFGSGVLVMHFNPLGSQ